MIKEFIDVSFIVIMIILLVLILWRPFGKAPSKKLQKEYEKKTKFFYDGKFHSMETFKQLTNPLEALTKRAKDRYPINKIPVKKIKKLPEVKQWAVTWFGHSTVMLQIEDKNVFIDPILSQYSSPFQFIGGKRITEIPMEINDIPEVDVFILSHDHYDHLDYRTICKIDSKVKDYVVPLGVDQHLIRFGINSRKIHALGWWDSIELSEIQFTLTPGQHFSGRLPWKNNTTLWGGYVMKKGIQQIYYSGDTGYGEFYKEINKRFGKMDLAIMENGQYNHVWAKIHMFPEQSVQASKILEATVVLPVHWAGFVLSSHGWKDSIERFTVAAHEVGLNVITPKIGETVEKDSISDFKEQWWKELK